jgi:hypothetical protein
MGKVDRKQYRVFFQDAKKVMTKPFEIQPPLAGINRKQLLQLLYES